jgi:hypothetical protein
MSVRPPGSEGPVLFRQEPSFIKSTGLSVLDVKLFNKRLRNHNVDERGFFCARFLAVLRLAGLPRPLGLLLVALQTRPICQQAQPSKVSTFSETLCSLAVIRARAALLLSFLLSTSALLSSSIPSRASAPFFFLFSSPSSFFFLPSPCLAPLPACPLLLLLSFLHLFRPTHFAVLLLHRRGASVSTSHQLFSPR